MALDPVKNFAKCVVSLGYDDVATSIVLQAGDGAKLPTPATDGAFNLVWWNSTDYADPSDDPNKEVVRCTARTTDTLTIARAQEGTTATTKNTASKTYKMILTPTKKTIDDIVSGLFGTPFYVDVPNSRVGIGTTTPTHYVHMVLPATDNFFIDASTNQRTITEGVFRINHTPAMSGTRPFHTAIDANGQGDTHAFVADFVATSIVAGDTCNLFEASIDTANSSGGTVKAFVVDKVGAGSVNVIGLGVLAGCDVISQNSGSEVAADQGFKYDTGFTDTTTAFGSGATNVQIFVNDNDYIYIGHASTFDDIRVVLAIAASQNINALFQYSAGAGSWTTFNPSDSTNGFTVNGNIAWQLPLTGWTTDTVNAIANKYWIRIQRTRNSLTTPPTESTIKIITSTIYSWDKNGAVSVASLTLGTPLAVAQGGTAATTAAGARTNLGVGFWQTVPGTPTRVSNTQFTITDTGGANGYVNIFAKGVCLKWTDSGTKQAMIISSSYATNTVTINIIGDTLGAGFSAMYFGQEKARQVNFAIAGTLATGTDLAGHFYAPFDMKIFGADVRVATAGTTNSTDFDINDDGTTMFTTKPSIASAGTSDVDNTADTGTIVLEDSKITVDIDAVSTTAPVDAYITLFFAPNNNQYLI